MPNISITNRNLNGITVWDPVFEDHVLTAAGAETWPAGAVLGKITASGKLARFDVDAVDGTEAPYAVLTQPVEFTGAGDRTERPAISGRLRRRDLVDDEGTAITDKAVDQLRGVSIIVLTTHQLSEQDNQ